VKKLLAVLILVGGCAGPQPEPDPLGEAVRYRVEPSSRPKPPQDAPVSGLTQERALLLAERTHPDLAMSAARIEASEGRTDQAGAFPNPVLVARMESAPFKGGTTGNAEYPIGVSQRLPVGGRLGAASDAERLETERLGHEHALRVLEVQTRVSGAFATALFSAEVARLQQELLGISRRAVTVARARRDAGDATADEVARTEMEEARARLEEDKAHGLRELALVALAASLGDPALRIESVEGKLESALEIPTVEQVLASLDAGPHAALARLGVEAAKARVDLARAERIPDVTLDLFYRRLEHSKSNAFDVGVVIPLPLFDGNQGRIHAAEAERREAEARARSVRGDAVRRVREAHVKLSEAVNHTKLAKEAILPKAEIVLKVAEARYGAGELSLADVLPIRRDYAAARLAYLDGLREVMEAWSELKVFLR
jgi:outer membrane protein, heavy metal efflux system